MLKNESSHVAPGQKERQKRKKRSKGPILRGGEKEVLEGSSQTFSAIPPAVVVVTGVEQPAKDPGPAAGN
jgi:hypothetical protein